MLYRNPGHDPNNQQWQGKTAFEQEEALSRTRLLKRGSSADELLVKGGGKREGNQKEERTYQSEVDTVQTERGENTSIRSRYGAPVTG